MTEQNPNDIVDKMKWSPLYKRRRRTKITIMYNALNNYFKNPRTAISYITQEITTHQEIQIQLSFPNSNIYSHPLSFDSKHNNDVE